MSDYDRAFTYVGARLSAAGPTPEPPTEIVVEFSDGVAAPARLLPGLRLEVEPHVTARGAAIPAKAWSLAPDPARPETGWKVAKRLA